MPTLKPGLLGTLGAKQFLARYWQRKPLLIRGALAGFADPIPVRGVLGLAARPDVASRLVTHRAGRWTLEHGPFAASRYKQLPRRDWTVLVSDTNHFDDAAARLLGHFDFIAHARVDDLMVSYAVPGGSVGPHVDSYDVFLLQGHGRRRWRISGQRDLALRPGLPLKILERFEPEEEWVLEAGDMLYLPPGVAHHGIAETECLTWSVGFRAPTHQEWAAGFLDFLHDRLDIPGHYRDPGALPARNAGEIPAPLLAQAAGALARIRWNASDVREFAGRYLSEPKAHVVFDPPPGSPTRARFEAEGAKRGVALDRRACLLFSGSMYFMNGEAIAARGPEARVLRRLAHARALPGPLAAPRRFWDLAHEWHRQGALHLQQRQRP